MFNQYIYTFLKVAELGSFSKASEALFLSKVSVMNQINALEKEISVKLLDRSHRGVSLTAAGKTFYKDVKSLIGLSKKAIDTARKIDGKESKTIRIGTSLMRPCNAFLETVEQNLKNHPYRFQIVPFNDHKDELSEMLGQLGSTIDCFVSPVGLRDIGTDFGFLPIRSCQCCIALSKSHPLSCREKLLWSDLDDQSLLLLERGQSYILDELRDTIQSEHPGIHLIDHKHLYDLSVFNQCEENGYLMETLDIWSKLHPSLITLPVDWDFSIPYGLVYKKEPSEPVRSFVEAVRTNLADLSE